MEGSRHRARAEILFHQFRRTQSPQNRAPAMAGRSQLPVQIMENQTRFDLNAAIENWRNELAAQPNLASDDRRELETHLRDAITGFQQRGLNDEESFWLARRRVGQPQQLGEEFVKADPAKVWRERVFWMVAGIWIVGLFGFIILPTEGSLLLLLSTRSFLSELDHVFPAFILVQLLVLVALLVHGFAAKISLSSWLVKNRLRLATVFAISAWIACLQIENLNWLIRAENSQTWNWSYSDWTLNAWNNFVNFKFLIFGLLILLVWLMPTQNRK